MPLSTVSAAALLVRTVFVGAHERERVDGGVGRTWTQGAERPLVTQTPDPDGIEVPAATWGHR